MAATKDLRRTKTLLFDILKPEAGFFYLAIAYGLMIGLLTLAVPFAVQTLINTVVYTASVSAVLVISTILFCTLLLYGLFSALRTRVMEYYERRIYSRLTADLVLKTIQAPHQFFEGRKNSTITHRFFEVMTFQKNMPSLMVDGFALLLQMLVGITLVSFYHPFLFVFNVVIIIAMYFIWRMLSTPAKNTAIDLSDSKYATAKWLSEISSAHVFFKSSRHLDHAAEKTEAIISRYVNCHAGHFTFTFSQTVLFLIVYALASSALLGLGGVLVVQEQLSVGQLVAAELIMSAVFLGISRFSVYLNLYYELYGAAEKLNAALNIPQEDVQSSDNETFTRNDLHFRQTVLVQQNESVKIDMALRENGKYYVVTGQAWQQRKLMTVLKRYETPESGWVELGGLALTDYQTSELRQAIAIVDRSLIIECSILEYLRMDAPDASEKAIREIFRELQLEPTLARLEDGLQTSLSQLGHPLQPMEFLLLKLAAALLSKPGVIVLNQHFDAIPEAYRYKILKYLDTQPVTVMYFTSSPIQEVFDATIVLNGDSQLLSHDVLADKEEL